MPAAGQRDAGNHRLADRHGAGVGSQPPSQHPDVTVPGTRRTGVEELVRRRLGVSHHPQQATLTGGHGRGQRERDLPRRSAAPLAEEASVPLVEQQNRPHPGEVPGNRQTLHDGGVAQDGGGVGDLGRTGHQERRAQRPGETSGDGPALPAHHRATSSTRDTASVRAGPVVSGAWRTDLNAAHPRTWTVPGCGCCAGSVQARPLLLSHSLATSSASDLSTSTFLLSAVSSSVVRASWTASMAAVAVVLDATSAR